MSPASRTKTPVWMAIANALRGIVACCFALAGQEDLLRLHKLTAGLDGDVVEQMERFRLRSQPVDKVSDARNPSHGASLPSSATRSNVVVEAAAGS